VRVEAGRDSPNRSPEEKTTPNAAQPKTAARAERGLTTDIAQKSQKITFAKPGAGC
jgi:hypothetical protein